MDWRFKLSEAVNYLKSRGLEGRISIVLGSGLCFAVEGLKIKKEIDYRHIPYFPLPTVKGHPGKMSLVEWDREKIIILQGRTHYYEGYDLAEVTLPIRVLRGLGVEIIVLTNAAGGINPSLHQGDFMLITDHINFMGDSPLRGVEVDPRFVSLTNAYDQELSLIYEKAAHKLNIPVKKGIYLAVSGSAYETLAEIRMYRLLGADAVGMSTVPEVIVARQLGIRVLGISVIANSASNAEEFDHNRIITIMEVASRQLGKLLSEILTNLSSERK